MEKSLIFLVAIALIAIVQCVPQNNNKRVRTPEERAKFQAWRAKFRKNYKNGTEESEAMEKMLRNREKIIAHNKLFDEGKVTFRQALWKHSDLSDAEKRKALGGLQIPPQPRSARVQPGVGSFPEGPEYIDWREVGLVGPVHDQGLKTFSENLQQIIILSSLRCLRVLLGFLSYWCH